MSATRRILVAGDHGFDYDLYLHGKDDNPPPGSPPTEVRVSVGGAGIALRVLQEIALRRAASRGRAGGDLKVGFAPSPGGAAGLPVLGLWQKTRFGRLGRNPRDEDTEVWRTRRSMSLGGGSIAQPFAPVALPQTAPKSFAPDIILAEDNGGGFRFRIPAWLAALADRRKPTRERHVPGWVVFKTSAPVSHGSFWWTLVGTPKLADRLIVIVAIKDLRRSEIRVSQGISWERTAEDLSRELARSPVLEGLRHARHVIVTMHGEGALWMERTRRAGADAGRDFKLIFDPGHMEGEWSREVCGPEGDAYGYHSTFAAAIAAHLALEPEQDERRGLSTGIKRGLLAMRMLRAVGHGVAAKGVAPGLPLQGLAEVILADDPGELDDVLPGAPPADWARLGGFGEIEVSSDVSPTRTRPPARAAAQPVSGPEVWRILEAGDGPREAHQPLYGLARRVALLGLAALNNVPYARFGDLFTVDRDEIEALRNIQRLLEDYERSPDDRKPLSIGVFGPPGAGKSFAVKQVARTVIDEKRQSFLEFNLSQFADPDDLIGAFHQVRDKVLEGRLPVVFWDEFDSKGYQWLQYLLAPMQDGKFQEGQITHPIGRCMFVFAGATSYSFEHFGPPAAPRSSRPATVRQHQEAAADFRLKKGPDFKSRLQGCLDVLGPNPRLVFDPTLAEDNQWKDDPGDVCFPVRRAVFLRSWLGLMSPKKRKDHQRLRMDPGLMAALVDVGHYRHGARSMEKIVTTIRLGGDTYHRSALPTDEVLALNLREPGQFKTIMDQPHAFQRQAWQLAPAIHAAWYPSAAQGNALKVGFDALDPETKADNYAAAVRIPGILGLAGLQLVRESAREPAVPRPEEVLNRHLELLAEEEHDQWMEVKIANGWTLAPPPKDKDELMAQRALRKHHALVPYAKLSPEDKLKDSRSITNYPTVARLARFKIVARRPPTG